MCGIVGIVSGNERPVLAEELRAMSDSIAHRGPDDDGFYVSRHAGLGMRRLSIIDLNTGKQPISNEDGSVHVVFNGEIYNYKQLRQELQRLGHRFATTTDTEVIVHLYEERGPDCVHDLRGMFGFALWDEKRHQLLLARDRFGIKPIYYAEIGGRLVFASELKAILQLPEVERGLNWDAVSHLFSFLSTPITESIIHGIHKLAPGHLLLLEKGKSRETRRYWDIRFEPDHSRSEGELAERLRELLAETVSLHMVSDVPIGAFLSGGVDSAAVVSQMVRLSRAPVKTFTIGFTEDRYNEADYAKAVSKRYGTEHFELILDPDVLEFVEEITWHLDEPFGDSSAIPTYMVSKLAAQQVKVVLSGDGGDELFAGYEKYIVAQKEQRYDRLPVGVRWASGAVASMMPTGMRGANLLHHLSLEPTVRYLDSVTLFPLREKRRLFQDDALGMMESSDFYSERASLLQRPARHWLSSLQALDFATYLPLDILTKVDRMSMAHSLEVRPPLLDHKFAEFVATIPPEFLLQNGRTKHLFKSAMKNYLPDGIVNRPKQGFAVPLNHWFRGRMSEYVRDLLLSRRATNRGIFRPAQVERLLNLHASGRNMDLHLWTLISFEMWCRLFLDRVPESAARKLPEVTTRPAVAMAETL